MQSISFQPRSAVGTGGYQDPETGQEYPNTTTDFNDFAEPCPDCWACPLPSISGEVVTQYSPLLSFSGFTSCYSGNSVEARPRKVYQSVDFTLEDYEEGDPGACSDTVTFPADTLHFNIFFSGGATEANLYEGRLQATSEVGSSGGGVRWRATRSGRITRGTSRQWAIEDLDDFYEVPNYFASVQDGHASLGSNPDSGSIAFCLPSVESPDVVDVRRGRYKLRFKPPSFGGVIMRWVSRFCPPLVYQAFNTPTGYLELPTSGGGTITGVEVVYGGLGYHTATPVSYLNASGGVAAIAYRDLYNPLGRIYSVQQGGYDFSVTGTWPFGNNPYGGNGYSSVPAVTIAPPDDPNGRQATATAVVEFGRVVRYDVTDPGTGYTSPPLVRVAPPSGGRPPIIEVDRSYLRDFDPLTNGPTPNRTAVLTPVMNPDGTIASVTVSGETSGYFRPRAYCRGPFFLSGSDPGYSGLGMGAILRVHVGQETPKEYVWNGQLPEGYDPDDETTWPTTGYYTEEVPEQDGLVVLAAFDTTCTFAPP